MVRLFNSVIAVYATTTCTMQLPPTTAHMGRDLNKAIWYLQREIQRIVKAS
jgi:hypothetical protein